MPNEDTQIPKSLDRTLKLKFPDLQIGSTVDGSPCRPSSMASSAEYLELNEESRIEQARHAEVLRAYETQKRARSIIVPTAIEDIKARLRELGQPVTLFGEGHADRRERLREVIAKFELDEESAAQVQVRPLPSPHASLTPVIRRY